LSDFGVCVGGGGGGRGGGVALSVPESDRDKAPFFFLLSDRKSSPQHTRTRAHSEFPRTSTKRAIRSTIYTVHMGSNPELNACFLVCFKMMHNCNS
jgi:hypothetical protein